MLDENEDDEDEGKVEEEVLEDGAEGVGGGGRG